MHRFVICTLQGVMTNCIKHTGIVEEITATRCKVRILQSSACSSCSVKSHCTTSESKEKIIDAYVLNGETYSIGEEVMVSGQLSTGYKAVFLAFILPLILLVASAMITMPLLKNELLCVVITLLVVAIYYGVLSLFRDRLQKQFCFWIEKI